MAKKSQYRRLICLTGLLLAAFGVLAWRLVDLQVVQHGALSREARENTRHVERFEPRRGDILDRKGILLATSVMMKTVCADPSLVGSHQPEIARALAPLLQLKETELAQKLTPRLTTNAAGKLVTNQYVVLKHKVANEVWERVRETMQNLPLPAPPADDKKAAKLAKLFNNNLRQKSVFVDPVDEQLRVYPNQNLAAHVLGFTGQALLTNGTAVTSETVGVDGIEKTMDTKLRGVRGLRVTERDGKQREVISLRAEDLEPKDGYNVVLTIDSVIQTQLEAALAEGFRKNSPISISGIVVRPRTGEILALATLPNYDPNDPGRTPPTFRANRAISDVAEPGSTFKVVVISGALEDGIIRLTDQFDCEHGHFVFGGKTLHEAEAAGFGILTAEEIITHSSNIGAAKVGIKMGDGRLFKYICDFGFSVRTGIPLPAESPGFVRPLAKWTPFSISRVPMGQEVSMTPLQMVMAMSAIANHGVLMHPMLIQRLTDKEGRTVASFSPQTNHVVISEATDKLMIQALKTVVLKGGTAELADLAHYTVAGKTGTAQKFVDGHYGNKSFSSFIGFFPADDPELCIYVALDEPKGPHFGGKVAAPVFKVIAEKAANYLNIRPDKDSGTNAPAPAMTLGSPVKVLAHAP